MSEIPQGCKPFNLQEALAGNPVVTRDGRKVKIAGYNLDDRVSQFHQVIGWLDSKVEGFNESGSWNGTISDNDLFMAAEKKDVWVLLISTIVSNVCTSSYIRYSEEDAKHLENTMIKSGYKTYGIHKITINI